jgi:hypothetical protein
MRLIDIQLEFEERISVRTLHKCVLTLTEPVVLNERLPSFWGGDRKIEHLAKCRYNFFFPFSERVLSSMTL